MEFVVLTGMSGAGKTNALHSMEDLGFYCVDNLPPALLATFYDLCINSSDSRMKKVAVVADSRSGNIYKELADSLTKARAENKTFKILFLDANKETLLRRYKETRRKHPLAKDFSDGSVQEAIELEDNLVKPFREMSDFIIDSSGLSSAQLRERVQTLFTHSPIDGLIVNCISFGYKYGVPLEADMIVDVRCLPNPFYVPELNPKTGLDQDVRDYVMNSNVSSVFVNRLFNFLDFSIPQYQKEGKSEFVIGVGCTGGKHRSVTIARLINSHLIDKNISSSIHHRDIWKA